MSPNWLKEVFSRQTDRVRSAMKLARSSAYGRGDSFVAPEHLLVALAEVRPGPGSCTLKRLGVDLAKEKEQLETLLPSKAREAEAKPQDDPRLKEVMNQAIREAKALKHNYLGTEHLVLGLLAVGGPANAFLHTRGVTAERFRPELLRFLNRE